MDSMSPYGSAALALIVFLSPSIAGARPLTMRQAERAIDLAWQAELGGDEDGANRSLDQLVTTATTSSSIAPKARIVAWQRGLETRREAFRSFGRSTEAYRVAHETLRGFGLRRSELLWRRAVQDHPDLAMTTTSSASVELRPEGLAGVGQSEAMDRLKERLLGLGFSVQAPKQGRFLVRFVVDAVETEPRGRRVAVIVQGSAVMSDKTRARTVFGTFYRRRTEVRLSEIDARRMAVRRILEDLAEDVVFRARCHVLTLRSGGTMSAFDSGARVGSK